MVLSDCSDRREDRARQTQALKALEPFADLRAEQFGVRGSGRNEAIRELESLTRERNQRGYVYRHFMALDIRDCYSSIEALRLGEFLRGKLPQEVIRYVLTNQDRRADIRTSHTDDHIHDEQSALRHGGSASSGLPQGSACSSLVAAMVVAWALERLALPTQARLLNYADNIIVVGTTKEDVEATHSSLCSLLRTSPVGQLELRREAIGRIADGIEWLGYQLGRHRHETEIRPTDTRIEEFRTKTNAELTELVARSRQLHSSVRLRDAFIGYVKLEWQLPSAGQWAADRRRWAGRACRFSRSVGTGSTMSRGRAPPYK